MDYVGLSCVCVRACVRACVCAVSVVLKERRSRDSVTLAWQGPDRPNGVIVEYEVIYYEKVRITKAHARTHARTHAHARMHTHTHHIYPLVGAQFQFNC